MFYVSGEQTGGEGGEEAVGGEGEHDDRAGGVQGAAEGVRQERREETERRLTFILTI